MNKRKPKPQPPSFEYALSCAWAEAALNAEGQTVEQAKEAFLEHWGRAVLALGTMLEAGEAELTGEIVNRVSTLLRIWILPMIRKDTVAGQFAFNYAQDLTREVMRMSTDNPPDWLVRRAPVEYEVPWLMVNRKPAPGFAESVATLEWGRKVVKAGKHRFTKPQTRDVSAALLALNKMRSSSYVADLCENSTPERRADLSRLLELDPLSQTTKEQWWPLVRNWIRRNHSLTLKELQKIRETVACETDRTVLSEYVNNYCRKAFDALCPPIDVK